MQPDIVIDRLFMRVEPSDSSYMPSLVVVKAGQSLGNIGKELRTVTIGSNDNLVTLLQDMTEVFGFRVTSVRVCRV